MLLEDYWICHEAEEKHGVDNTDIEIPEYTVCNVSFAMA
jgi:hypothetical protein